MNIRFVLRGLLVALPVAAISTVIGFALLIVPVLIGPPPDATPVPPTILAPRGPMPSGTAGFEEWVQVQGEVYHLAGSGFFLALDGSEVVGVSTAHSVPFGDPGRRVERMGFRVAGQVDFVIEFVTLHGRPGRARTGEDLTVDYVFLRCDRPIDPSFVLAPDPRGAPQPGERVTLISGLGDGEGGPHGLEGTVQSVDDQSVWVLMDGLFDPRMMSGSPFVSQHTGQVVGMLIAGTSRRGRPLLGAHPVGSIVRLAQSATDFPRLDEFRR